MADTTTRDTILQTVSIQNRQHLWRLSQVSFSRRRWSLWRHKKVVERISSVRLVSSSRDLLYSGSPLWVGPKIRYGRWWTVMCAYTTWLLRMRGSIRSRRANKLYHMREGPLGQPNHQVPASWAAFIAMRQEIRDYTMHQLLQDDLVEHIWRFRGNTH
jgi:hypothetical protein